VLGEQPVDLDTKFESTTPKTDETNEGMVIDTITSTLEPESPKQSIFSDDFFQELDEERKLADSVQQYYSTLKIERDPYIFKDRPFKPKNKKHNLNTDSMIVETGSDKSVKINSMGTLVEQNLFAMRQFRAPFVLGLWTACLLLIFGSFATALFAVTTFITLFVYFGDMLSNTSAELVKTISAAWSTISLIVFDFYSFISNYKYHFLTHRDPTSTVHKVSGPKRLAKTDVLYDKQEGIVRHEPDISHAMESTTYNYKIPLRIENQSEVLCEIDSDSHLNLITEWYFRKIQRNCKVEFLKEKPVEFFGMGSTLTSDYPPVMLKVQVGRVAMRARFIITKELFTSPVLLGSDFLVKNKMSISLFSDGHWWVSIGPVDNPIGKIKCLLTHKVTVMTNGDVIISPFTCHKIRVKTNSDELFTNYESDIFKPNDCLDKSTLVLFEGGRDSITLSNFSPLPLNFPNNFPLGELEALPAVHLTTENSDLINTYKEQVTDEGLNDRLEDSLEEISNLALIPSSLKKKTKS
jgi:hypothetical protein